jgi:uncharacterized protein
MDLHGAHPLYFATDLTNFLACRHLTALERLSASGLARRPVIDDPMLEILQARGLEHERAYVQHLAQKGKRVVEIVRGPRAQDDTLAAMRDGADVIVQARLAQGSWAGWADVLLRVEGRSRLGAWRYEPVETKLARETRGATLIQLCLYADLLDEMQGAPPEWLRVVVPDYGFEPEEHRFEEFRAYFRLVRRNLEAELARPLAASVDAAQPYPEPVAHCDVCRWWSLCDRRWTRDDHVSRVAGIHRGQRSELASWGVTTLEALARLPLPLPRWPRRGSQAALERMREQARLQLEARTQGRPTYELLAIESEQGLASLPAPSPLDLFLDFEGDPQAEHGGRDYLFGYVARDEEGKPRYAAMWALSRAAEKAAFERLIDLIVARRARDPAMHVYHYAPYEPTAMKRLMGRYATRADELDRLLRGRVFVDLYRAVRGGLRAGVDSYSIKKLEAFYGLVREVDLRQASRHLRAVEYAIAKGDADALGADIREAVASYNRDDCLSALQLRDWLERLRVEAESARGEPLPRPVPPESEQKVELTQRLAHRRALAEALLADLPVERDHDQQATWVLAHLLEWHRREDKVEWWEFFRLNEMAAEELREEPAAIAGLEFDSRLDRTKLGAVTDRYRFPAQDTDLHESDKVYEPGQEKPKTFGTITRIDFERRTVDIKKTRAFTDDHPSALFGYDVVQNPEAEDALVRLAEFVRDHGIDAPGAYRAGRDLLLRRNPRLTGGEPLCRDAESTTDSARRAALALDGGVLAIQGPPGTGKTFSGARMIIDLVRSGRSVGVAASSHKVIRNLLKQVVQVAGEEGVAIRCIHRVPEDWTEEDTGIENVTDGKKAAVRIAGRECDVAGGTVWHWARPEQFESVDVLFVDEAGQMSLANVVAGAQGARNLVLLGDPQQLEQPQKASHPEGAEVSALQHLLEGNETMPPERGLFLGQTWRLHPSICRFTSELFYEGKLQPDASLEAQRVSGPTPFAGTGLIYVPVVHEGNQNSSPEEAERVAEIVKSILDAKATWTDRHGNTRTLRLSDILIVAPYNAQVSEILERIPGANAGTVDKFQGQQAPIVIYSMATSTPADAPHGMEFLFSRNRLNVATSRARCLVILVGNPQLFELSCRTPDQMRMANAYCRYLELARVVGDRGFPPAG